MNKNILLFTVFFIVNNFGFATSVDPFVETFKFATLDEAKKMISTEDEYTDKWCEFDINSKSKNENGSKALLLEYASTQMLKWEEDEKNKVIVVLKKIQKGIARLDLNLSLPENIYFIKSTCEEEGGAAGYTRANYIVINQNFLADDTPSFEHLITHEIFHVLSRYDTIVREKLYNIIGFRMMDQIIYPDSIKNSLISNPDAPLADSYIELIVDKDTIACVMIIYSDRPYSGGSFFEYLNIGLLSLNRQGEKKPLLLNGNPIIYSINEVDNFFEQVGKNTNYIINPEEILADNFTFLIHEKKDLPSQWIVDKMYKILSN